jgi:hypothetical protein
LLIRSIRSTTFDEATPATVAQTKRTTIFSCAEGAPSVNPRQPGAPRVIEVTTTRDPEGSPLAGMELEELGP